MLSPSPVPLPTSFVVKNGSKMRSGCEMPGPLSRNAISIWSARDETCDLDLSRAAHFLYRVVGVVQNIQKHLLQLVRIADGQRQFLGVVFADICTP